MTTVDIKMTTDDIKITTFDKSLKIPVFSSLRIFSHE